MDLLYPNAEDAKKALFSKLTWAAHDGSISQIGEDSVFLDIGEINNYIKPLESGIPTVPHTLTLEELRTIVGATYEQEHWLADIYIDYNDRICFQNVRFRSYHESMGHYMDHPVFSSISFKDVVLTLKVYLAGQPDPIIKKLYFDQYSPIRENQVQPPGIPTNFVRFGVHGSIGKKENILYQAGFSHNKYYYIKLAKDGTNIGINMEFSTVFGYSNNVFEPTGVINSAKIFPQISIAPLDMRDEEGMERPFPYSLDLSSQFPESAKIAKVTLHKVNARIKMVVNNNSSHHIETYSFENKLYDKNLFYTLRNSSSGNHVHRAFDKYFKADYLQHNIVGLYTDSNNGRFSSSGPKDDRRRPPIVVDLIPGVEEPSLFWSNIFDYGLYNIGKGVEFIAAYGAGTDDFDGNDFKERKSRKLTYPINNPNPEEKIEFVQMKRQGAFDNIHLHGYLGHYEDVGQPVVHAPICGYCCFHMHWRWSKLNADIATKQLFQNITNTSLDRQSTLDKNAKKFLGWDNFDGYQLPSRTPGLPLIPCDQTLKIAITHPDTIPYDIENRILAKSSGDLDSYYMTNDNLDPFQKAVWYCVEILCDSNLSEPDDAHLIFEQGCGYAHSYSKIGKRTVGSAIIPALAPKWIKDEAIPVMLAPPQLLPDEVFMYYLSHVSNISPIPFVTVPFPVSLLSVSEYFEMQYRLMKYFHDSSVYWQDYQSDYWGVNQVPIADGNYIPRDGNSQDNLLSNLGVFINSTATSLTHPQY